MIIVHLPVAKFWAALIIGVHWLSRQVWSFTPTLIANVAVSRAWIQAGFLPRWRSVFIRFQIDISGRQENSTPPSLDQTCTSISCPQLGKNSTQANASQVSFPHVVPGTPGRWWQEAFQDHQKQDPFWMYLMEISFRRRELPTFALISRARDEFPAVLAYSET